MEGIITNIDLLQYSLKAGSSAIMVLMIIILMYMLNRSQKAYMKNMEKYATLLEKQVESNIKLTYVVQEQNKHINNILELIRKNG